MKSLNTTTDTTIAAQSSVRGVNPWFIAVTVAVERLAGLIDPKKVVAGGKSDPAARYLDPTIIYPVTWDHPIMEDEIFGPSSPTRRSMKRSKKSRPLRFLSQPTSSAKTKLPSIASQESLRTGEAQSIK